MNLNPSLVPVSDHLRSKVAPIRAILSDVDGVMTDGRITYDSAGIETKQFHARDGLAIKLWMKTGFQFGILTARNSPIVQRRADELGIETVMQGFEQKWSAASNAIADWNLTPDQVCYIGDDLPDLAVMKHVGLSVAPADAASDVMAAADWVLKRDGGTGVIRELVESILRESGRWQEHLDAL
ncbi:3-deoxy-D-manno-octulosonate 8-phosphate phosphatase KdsC [Rubripirellula obstinata]|uniref:3-deoxy-D-manno-octulosonate 8-phosphate phosphatase KdsC n=1 Tax=Rubripirellula obstinata TaxID=406547 RepID=A0A5B1CBQ8_9BACT|nr:HAD hydrolase family protein [Rubripirellula obstinata]KAA1258547.1 3-deoxy-D-manno-octulosonate 8-phosphate phosphatase KdsC [Rubripirellula obstinata]